MELALCYVCWIRMGRPGAAGCGALLDSHSRGGCAKNWRVYDKNTKR